MSKAARQIERIKVNLNPAAWLIAPTLSLLFGQTVAAGPWPIPPAAVAISLLPLLFVASSRWRYFGDFCFPVDSAFAIGYLRHRELLVLEFPHHLRSVMEKQERLYLRAGCGWSPRSCRTETAGCCMRSASGIPPARKRSRAIS
jgi:hypothetical protein